MTSDPTRRRTVDDLTVAAAGPTVVVVGGEAAKGLATVLDDEFDVRVVSDDPEVVRAAAQDDLDAREADIRSGSDLIATVDGASGAVVAAERDRVNLLAAQLLRTVCDVDDVVVKLNDPSNRELFVGIDVAFLEDRPALGRDVQRALFGEPT